MKLKIIQITDEEFTPFLKGVNFTSVKIISPGKLIPGLIIYNPR